MQKDKTSLAYYKGHLCRVKTIEKTDCKITRNDLIDFKLVSFTLVFVFANFCKLISLQTGFKNNLPFLYSIIAKKKKIFLRKIFHYKNYYLFQIFA